MQHPIFLNSNTCFTYLDGGMGTLLQAIGLRGGERPETWNLQHPERILEIHLDYLAAGCDIITSNTFGASAAHLGADAEKCMKAGIRIARQAVLQAKHGYVAANMGSIGRLIEPYGDLPFEDAVTQFRNAFIAALEENADLFLIETMTELLEIKACVLGAKEAMETVAKTVPLFVSLTFDDRGRLLTGANIEGTVAMLCGLRVDAIGLNCGDEPRALLPNVRSLANCCPLPIFVSPNASLPVVIEGKTTFPTTPEDFGRDMLEIAKLGAWGLGGCCGTTPAHIRSLVAYTKNFAPIQRVVNERCVISGRSSSMVLGGRPAVIGERLNPTGKSRMKQALRENDMDYLLREALNQCDNGADILDINVGLPEINEVEMLEKAVKAVQSICELPLQIDTANPQALEAALRCYAGKPLINSVCGKQTVMDAVFPLATKYGGALVALTLDEKGIPETVEGRLKIAEHIISEAEKYGISKNELLFDALTMTVATNTQAAKITLATVRALHEKGLKTVLGVSNVSFGLPQRPLLTASFIAMALANGLDAAIMNPSDLTIRAIFDAATAVSGRDDGFERYLATYGASGVKIGIVNESEVNKTDTATIHATNIITDNASITSSDVTTSISAIPVKTSLYQFIRKGLPADAVSAAHAALKSGTAPLSIIESSIMPALGEVGELYERGILFLPQLLQSANAAQSVFEIIRVHMPNNEKHNGRKVVLATVKGDVHDIGKNIVKVLLQNYGFSVIDLGKDVPPEAVVQAVRKHGATLVGLSALMTTTIPSMRETIERLHAELPDVRVMVGGAVLTEDFAKLLGADGYGKDAMASVRLAQAFLGKS